VDPKDVSVINPPDGSGRYLTLMTCVPPGFNAKRLIVLAKLANT
jgi:LPXTG-site transpeptidase (sortase) family protein